MPFNSNGQFVPQAGQTVGQVTPAQPQRQPMMMNQNAMQQANPMVQNQQAMQQYNPQMLNQAAMQKPNTPAMMLNQSMMNPVLRNNLNFLQQPQSTPNPGAQPSWVQPASNQSQAAPQQNYAPPGPFPPSGNQMGMQPGWGGQNFGVAQGQQMQQGQSIEQGVQNNNPQSVQNFMSALHNVGAGSSNGMMNGYGQQGAGAQAGFQGFGSNGYQGMVGTGVGAGNVQYANSNFNGGQDSYTGNSGGAGQMYGMGNQASNGAYSMSTPQGAQGGFVLGQGTNPGMNPTWQTPAPWGQPGNAAPGTPGSNYSNDNNGWNKYLGIGGNQTPVSQPANGSFYSNVAPGQPAYGPQGGSVTPEGGYLDANGNYSGTGAGPVAISDKHAKTNITIADKELSEFLNALGVYSYEYKDKQNGEGRFTSTMAQDLEKTAIGKSMVETRPDGIKQVNYGRGFATMLASQALLNHKYNAMEIKLKRVISENLKKRKK